MEDSLEIDLSGATTAIDSMVQALKEFVTSNTPVIFSVAGAFIVFWLLKVAIRLIKSFSK